MDFVPDFVSDLVYNTIGIGYPIWLEMLDCSIDSEISL